MKFFKIYYTLTASLLIRIKIRTDSGEVNEIDDLLILIGLSTQSTDVNGFYAFLFF